MVGGGQASDRDKFRKTPASDVVQYQGDTSNLSLFAKRMEEMAGVAKLIKLKKKNI